MHTVIQTTSGIPDNVLSDLRAVVGERLSVAPAVGAQYASGEAFTEAFPPDAMALPVSTEEVSRLAAICHRDRIPMIASAAATSLEGHITAPLGGLGINPSLWWAARAWNHIGIVVASHGKRLPRHRPLHVASKKAGTRCQPRNPSCKISRMNIDQRRNA